jgi:hypothetical protein
MTFKTNEEYCTIAEERTPPPIRIHPTLECILSCSGYGVRNRLLAGCGSSNHLGRPIVALLYGDSDPVHEHIRSWKDKAGGRRGSQNHAGDTG